MQLSHDYETNRGRTKYASNTAGGYYATRLPILKYLYVIKRQASVLVIRLETPSYWAALGVWVVRESVKKALNNLMKFESREELLKSAEEIGNIKFNFSCSTIFNKSRLLKQIKEERRLGEWF